MRFHLLLFAIFLCACATLARGDGWSPSPRINNPICTAAGDQDRVIAIKDNGGGIICVWADKRPGSKLGDIYAQRVDADGKTKWSPDGVLVSSRDKFEYPSHVIYDGAGGAVIVATENEHPNRDYIFRVYRIDSNGSMVWPEGGAFGSSARHEAKSIAIAKDNTGGFVTGWAQSSGSIFAQRVSSSGTISWETPTTISDSGDAHQIDFIADGESGTIAAWLDKTESGEDMVFVQRLNIDGVKLWQEVGVPVSSANGGFGQPCMTTDMRGGAIVASFGDRGAVTLQRISSEGSIQWLNEGLIVTLSMIPYGYNFVEYLSIVSDSHGGAIIGFGASYFDPPFRLGPRFAVGRVNSFGNLMWLLDKREAVFNLPLSHDGLGGVFVARRYEGIKAQHYNSFGHATWKAGEVQVAENHVIGELKSIVPDGRGGIICTWSEKRDGLDADIYCERVLGTGELSPPESVSWTIY